MITANQLAILRHSLGIDDNGQGTMYRNFYCAGPDDEAACRELVAMGFMREHHRTALYPNYNCSVSEAGKKLVRELTPPAPTLTRSQKRYRDYLRWADAYHGSFREYLLYCKEQAEFKVLEGQG